MTNKIFKNIVFSKKELIKILKNKIGIYQFINSINGHSYVGSFAAMDRRFKEYLSDNYRISNLNKGNSYIFRTFSKYGLENFDFKILGFLELDKDLSKIDKRKVILEREQSYIDSIKPEYNINKTAGSNLGKIFSDLNRKNLSKGKILLFSNK